jgi:putative RNA 2'-phosphotransferase
MKLIRASQGHSVTVDLGYKEKTPPSILYHGTAQRFLESIKKHGLLKQKRHHVHLTESRETALQTGARYGNAVLLTIEASKMSNNNFVFYQANNDVWLTESVPTEYISFP